MNGYYREFMPNEKEDNTQKQKTAGLPNESLENNNIRNNAINSQTNPRNVPQTNLQNNSQTNPQTNLRNVPQTNPQANPETNSQTNLQTNPQTNLRTNPQINSSINPQTVTQTSPQNDSQSIPQTISENNARTIPESIRQNNNQQTAQNNQNSNQVPTANNNNVQNNSNLQRNADSEGNYNEHLSRFNEQLGASINVNNQSNQTSNRQNYENIAESEVESLEGGENSETIRVPYTGNGKLIVQVTLARQAIPLENAKVTVNSTNGSPIEINEVRYTGQNGRTEPIDLHAIYTCSFDVLKKCSDYAKSNDMSIHTHLAETQTEFDDCVKERGMTPTEYMETTGIFDSPTIAAHCVCMTDNDLEILKKHNVSVVHNPISNLKLASGVAPITKMIDMGINVALGTDGASSNNSLDMFEEMKVAAILHKGITLDPTVMNAWTVLKMATVNGAKALGFDNLGVLKQGYLADMIILDFNSPHLMPNNNTVSNLVYAAKSSDVEYTIVNGKLVYNRQTKDR